MQEYIVSSFEEYVKVIEQYKGNHFFRGQANKEWSIAPSIFRQKELLVDEHKELGEELKKAASRPITKLFEMQHMGKKTRLLDLTIAPLAALYFVIEDKACAKEDGVVYIINKKETKSLESKEVLIIEEFLKGNNIEEISINLELPTSKILEVLTREQIIEYNYNFSYTNDRAILQGGTAVFFGGSIVDERFIPYSNRNIDTLIRKKIIIPAKIKTSIQKELYKLGYCKEVLYNNYSEIRMSEVEIIEENINVHKTRPFYKALILYRLSSYKVNPDLLSNKIKETYNQIYKIYGKSARVWLYFYYDEYDRAEGNWLCRSIWKNDDYQIKWNNNYYTTRMSRMNEEISNNDMARMLIPLVEDSRCAHLQIEELMVGQVSVDIIRNAVVDNEKRCTINFLKSTNIPKTSIDMEVFVEDCMQYISLIDSMIRDSRLYHTDISFKYYITNMLEQINNKWLKISPLLLDI